jgi:DnaK suppressor protein
LGNDGLDLRILCGGRLSPLTKGHLAELREQLEGQLARLKRSIEASEAALEPVELDQSRVGRLSRMDELQNQSLTRNLHEREEIRLTMVRNALARIEEGSYGLCAACESEIPYARLLVFPEAVECGSCP